MNTQLHNSQNCPRIESDVCGFCKNCKFCDHGCGHEYCVSFDEKGCTMHAGRCKFDTCDYSCAYHCPQHKDRYKEAQKRKRAARKSNNPVVSSSSSSTTTNKRSKYNITRGDVNRESEGVEIVPEDVHNPLMSIAEMLVSSRICNNDLLQRIESILSRKPSTGQNFEDFNANPVKRKDRDSVMFDLLIGITRLVYNYPDSSSIPDYIRNSKQLNNIFGTQSLQDVIKESKEYKKALERAVVMYNFVPPTSTTAHVIKMMFSVFKRDTLYQLVDQTRESKDFREAFLALDKDEVIDAMDSNNKTNKQLQLGLRNNDLSSGTYQYYNIITGIETFHSRKSSKPRYSEDLVKEAVDFIVKNCNVLLCKLNPVLIGDTNKNIHTLIRKVQSYELWKNFYHKKTQKTWAKNSKENPSTKDILVSYNTFMKIIHDITSEDTSEFVDTNENLYKYYYLNRNIINDIIVWISKKNNIGNEFVKNMSQQLKSWYDFVTNNYVNDLGGLSRNEVLTHSSPTSEVSYALSSNINNSQNIISSSQTSLSGFVMLEELDEHINNLKHKNIIEVDTYNKCKELLNDCGTSMVRYMSHILRNHINSYRINNIITKLRKGWIYVIEDYELKPMAFADPEEASFYYGKKGRCFHGCLVIYIKPSYHDDSVNVTSDDMNELEELLRNRATNVDLNMTDDNMINHIIDDNGKFGVHFVCQVVSSGVAIDSKLTVSLLQCLGDYVKRNSPIFGNIKHMILQTNSKDTSMYNRKFLISTIGLVLQNKCNIKLHLLLQHQNGVGKKLLNGYFHLMNQTINHWLNKIRGEPTTAESIALAIKVMQNTSVMTCYYNENTTSTRESDGLFNLKYRGDGTINEEKEKKLDNVKKLFLYTVKAKVDNWYNVLKDDENEYNKLLNNDLNVVERKFIINDNENIVYNYEYSLFRYDGNGKECIVDENHQKIEDLNNSVAFKACLSVMRDDSFDTGMNYMVVSKKYLQKGGDLQRRKKKALACEVCHLPQPNMKTHHYPAKGLVCQFFGLEKAKINHKLSLLDYSKLYANHKVELDLSQPISSLNVVNNVQDDTDSDSDHDVSHGVSIVGDHNIHERKISEYHNIIVKKYFQPGWAKYPEKQYTNDEVKQFLKSGLQKLQEAKYTFRLHKGVELLENARDDHGLPKFTALMMPSVDTITKLITEIEEMIKKESQSLNNTSITVILSPNDLPRHRKRQCNIECYEFQCVFDADDYNYTDEETLKQKVTCKFCETSYHKLCLEKVGEIAVDDMKQGKKDYVCEFCIKKFANNEVN